MSRPPRTGPSCFAPSEEWPMAKQGIRCSLSRSGNVRDSAAMERFFATLKSKRTAGKV